MFPSHLEDIRPATDAEYPKQRSHAMESRHPQRSDLFHDMLEDVLHGEARNKRFLVEQPTPSFRTRLGRSIHTVRYYSIRLLHEAHQHTVSISSIRWPPNIGWTTTTAYSLQIFMEHPTRVFRPRVHLFVHIFRRMDSDHRLNTPLVRIHSAFLRQIHRTPFVHVCVYGVIVQIRSVAKELQAPRPEYERG